MLHTSALVFSFKLFDFSNYHFTDDDIDDDLALEEFQNNKVLKKSVPLAVMNRLYKQRGMAYTRSNGVKVPARRCRDPCRCSKLQCGNNYNDEVRLKLMRNFLKLSSSSQNQFLANHVSVSFVAANTV